VNTRRASRNTKRADSIGTSAGQVSRERLGSTVTVLAIEQALAELGIHARLSDIVRGAQLIETAIIQSRSRRKPEQMC
jgi:hypothetical protein